ncbi:MAG: hypothetical protein IJP45_02555 [Paludibacteraceae bacterium]|nr:hypothetical protein [Paludibacteraceae bacterium]
MSKAVRWQVPFASIGGTQYRVDIYDEGYTGDPVTLLAGAEPFVTDEDDDEDFFAPVRSQTGTLQVCTAIPSGGTLNLSDILPDNNIARPVRLIKVGTTETIEWQGFLSCEAYNQDYTAIPENLSLNLISVLEAMDSVEVTLSDDMAFKTILGHVCYAMRAIQTQSGMTLFNQIYLTTYCRAAMGSTYFYNNVYFEADEQVSGDNIVVEVHSISCKEILEQVARFFGCCWREIGQNIWLEAIGRVNSYNFGSFSGIAAHFIDSQPLAAWLTAPASSEDIADCEWRGTDHQRSIAQGMRRVKVTAKLSGFECYIKLQETPVGNLVENPSERQSRYGEVHCNTNETFYSLAQHRHMRAKAIFPTDLSGASFTKTSDLTAINYGSTIFWTDNDFRTYYHELVINQTKGSNSGITYTLTSFMAWWRNTDNELQSGLMICGIPKYLYWSVTPIQGRSWTKFALTDSNYLFRQLSPMLFSAAKGYFKINIEVPMWRDAYGYKFTPYQNPALTIALKFGNKWLAQSGSTYSWSSSFTTIQVSINKSDGKIVGNWTESMGVEESKGLFVPISSFMIGQVAVYVYHEMDCIHGGDYYSDTTPAFEALISKLDVEYVPPKEELRTDRSENVYADETGQAFKDELSVDVELASYANNTKLATMIWSDSTTPAKVLSLGGSSVRPEAALLQRLKTYYGAARQKLTLEVAHPSTSLPVLTLNGINDGKTYTPIAESRDWRMEVSTLTCIENPS